MGKNLEPKCKQCRRIGEKLMLKGERCNSPKCAMVKKNYPPGFHGPKGRKRQSDYSLQLAEKQKAKKQYNILEKQFKLTFNRAEKKNGNTGDNLLRLLEMRLDNAVYRLRFAPSRNQARQLVNHGHFEVNGCRVNIPSYEVNSGDIIKVRSNSKNNIFFKKLIEKEANQKIDNIPSWLNLEVKNLEGKVLHQPMKEDIQTNINTQMIVEFYSR